MNEQTKAYFRAIEAKAKENRSSVSQGEESAYWNYRRSLENGNGEFECSELPWTTDMSDFVRTLREAGIYFAKRRGLIAEKEVIPKFATKIERKNCTGIRKAAKQRQ